MLRITPGVQVRELQRRINDAIKRRDVEALQELRQQLLLHRIETTRLAELGQMFAPVRQRLEAAVGALSLDAIGRFLQRVEGAIRDLIRSVRSWFESSMFREARAQRQESAGQTVGILVPPQLRSITGLPFDDTGQIKPKPGAMPPDLQDDDLTLREILLRISPLVVMIGDRSQEQRTPKRDLVLPGFTSGPAIGRDVTASVPAVARSWPTRVEYWIDRLEQLGDRLGARALDRSEPQLLLRDLRNELADVQTGVLGELRHESQRMRGRIDDEVGTRLPGDIYAGYTLHSRFLATTAPDHAARDGWKFYKDNRASSARSWDQRLIPPYRKNCVCFTIPIYETPEGDEYHAEFGLRVSGNQLISIRDVGTFSEWFDRQQPWVQQKLMGTRRWFAAASTGTGRLQYSDFVTPRGKLISIRRLLGETQNGRAARKERVRIIFEEQKRRHFAAWERGEGRFDMTPDVESEYRRRLDSFLRRVLKKSGGQ